MLSSSIVMLEGKPNGVIVSQLADKHEWHIYAPSTVNRWTDKQTDRVEL